MKDHEGVFEATTMDRVARLPPPVLSAGTSLVGAVHAYRRFGPGFLRRLRTLQERASWTQDAIVEWQGRRLSTVLDAASRSSFYSRALAQAPGALSEGSAEADVRERLASLPTIDRDVVARSHGDMWTRRSERVIRHRTSGTTGTPVEFIVPARLRWSMNAAHIYHFYSWHQFSPLQRRATLGGRYMGRNLSDGIVAHNLFERQLLLSTHSLSPTSILRYLDTLRGFDPVAIQGHPSAVAMFVTLAREAGLDIPSVSRLFLTGETLEDADRALLSEAFGGRVVSQYGHGEAAVLGAECEYGDGIHIDPFYGIVELLPVGDANLFEIVATSLLNLSMPLIRYRTGDLTTGWAEGGCPCGREWPRLRHVVGRTDDTLVNSAGFQVPAVIVRTTISSQFEDIPQWRVVQYEDSGQVDVELYTRSGRYPRASELAGTIEGLLDVNSVTIVHLDWRDRGANDKWRNVVRQQGHIPASGRLSSGLEPRDD